MVNVKTKKKLQNIKTDNNHYPPAVSVIIPVYNTEKYLSVCIESILDQTFRDFEIICINDGSTDASGEILRHYAGLDTRVSVIDQENHGPGPGHARNTGLAHAKGKYICFVDGDDSVTPGGLMELITQMEKTDADILFFNADVYGDGDADSRMLEKEKKYFHRDHDYPEVYRGSELFASMIRNGEYIASACTQFVKKSFLDRNGIRFLEKVVHEDELYTFHCFAVAEKTAYLNKAFYKRRVRAQSIMTSGVSCQYVHGGFITAREEMRSPLCC